MFSIQRIRASAVLIFLSLCFLTSIAHPAEGKAVSEASSEIKDPEVEEYLFGSGLEFPVKGREKVFLPMDNEANFTNFKGAGAVTVTEDKINFTLFEGAKEVVMTDSSLSFTITDGEAVLGWGNYQGTQPAAEIVDTWQELFAVQLKLSQSSEKSEWRVRYWSDGQPQPRTATTVLEGQGEQVLKFDPLRTAGPNPDGLELRIKAEAGTKINLKWIKLVQPVHEGYCRGEFILPEGDIWSAIANVTVTDTPHLDGNDEAETRLFINAKAVEKSGALALNHTVPLEIANYLKPGKNVAGFYGFRIGKNPPLYFQARIVMVSGEVIEVASGAGWKYSPDFYKGWGEADFDDSPWVQVKEEVLTGEAPRTVSGVMALTFTEREGSSPKIDLRGSARQVGIPAYSGRLALKNPSRPDLFYNSADEAIVEIHTPLGLKDRSPELTYYFSKADLDGIGHLVTKASVLNPQEQGNSLVYRVNLGKQPSGVYALALRLTGSDGETIAERPREPLVILQKLNLKKIAGKDYREGLDLELEDTIDFTNPDDPHPWLESRMPTNLTGMIAPKVETPTIQRQGGLVYREVTDSRRGSGFSYRIEFKHPGSFYLMELEYPDDAQRITVVSITSKREHIWTNSQTGAGIETGGKLYLTNEMQTLSWIHVADEGPHTVDVLNAINDQKAAAKSLKIYRIKGDLPSVESGSSRNYGIHSERCFYTSGIGRSFGSRYLKNAEGWEDTWLVKPETEPLMQVFMRDLVWLLETGERYVQYLKFSGQNTHVMGCYQYNEGDTPFVPSTMLKTSRIKHCMRTMMANLFDVNGIDFYGGIQFSQSGKVRGYANNNQVARGADTPWMINAKGEQRYGFSRVSEVQNILNPTVQGKYFELIDSVTRTFSHLPHFRGIHCLSGPDGSASYWKPGFGLNSNYDNPLESSFDDHTMERFAEETGIELSIDKNSLDRFAQRAEKLKGDAVLRQRFLDWRATTFTALNQDSVDRIKLARNDLELVNTLVEGDKKFYRYLASSGRSFKTIMKDFGIDLEAMGAIEGLYNVRWTVSWQDIHGDFPSQDSYSWMARTSPDITSAFARSRNRGVLIRTSWDENMLLSGGYLLKSETAEDRHILMDSDWIMNFSKTRTLPQPSGFHAREAFIQAIITADPQFVMGGWTDLHINVGHEQELRSIMKVFTHLPRVNFENALHTGLETNLAIRTYSSGDESWFYLANPGYWHVNGSVTISSPGKVYKLVSGEETGTRGAESVITIPVSLTPYGLAAFRVSSKDLKIQDYHTDTMDSKELAYLSNIIERADLLLADPLVKLSISSAERDFMHQAIASSREELAQKKYAKAWSRVTDYRFYHPWREILEKAVIYQAFLPEAMIREDENQDPDAFPTMIALLTTQPITIDGRLDEPAWDEAPFAAGFWKVKTKRKSVLETGVKVLYDDTNIYVAFACADKEPGALKADAKLEKEIYGSRDDVLAMMIQPDENTDLYYQLAFNSHGIHFDQRVENGGRNYDYQPDWKTEIWQGEKFWTAEVVIPIDSIEPDDLRGDRGDSWRINFYRKFRHDRVDPSSWSYQPENDWHTLKRLGYLKFE